MTGSAPTQSRWILIEYDGAWAPQVLDTALFDGRWAGRIRAVADDGVRIMFVRRPGERRQVAGTHRWWTIDLLANRSLTGEWSVPEDLAKAAAAVGDPLDESPRPIPPMLLVCTHAQRDVCCAVEGRPIAASLRARWPDRVWECSHLGGHRFAGTLIVLPDGAVYGGLGADSAADLVSRHLDGAPDAGHLRGRAGLSGPAQAAVVEALARWPGVGLEGVVVDRVRPDTANDSTTVVTLRGTGPMPRRVDVLVTTRVLPPALLSCHSDVAKPAAAHEVHFE